MQPSSPPSLSHAIDLLATGCRDKAIAVCEALLTVAPLHSDAAALLENIRSSPIPIDIVKADHRPAAEQELSLYFNPAFAQVLETWGDDNVWPEIRALLATRRGRVLDLACGTGRAFDFLRVLPDLSYHGCDISDMLIARAIQRGIAPERLLVLDATCTPYKNREFDVVFSIGSLEHFTEAGIEKTLTECSRICAGVNLHQLPVSRSGLDEGWISPYQSYWNNSLEWWTDRFTAVFGTVLTMDSRWSDERSVGRWFITFAPDAAR